MKDLATEMILGRWDISSTLEIRPCWSLSLESDFVFLEISILKHLQDTLHRIVRYIQYII